MAIRDVTYKQARNHLEEQKKIPSYKDILERKKMNEDPKRSQYVTTNYAGPHHQFRPRPEDMLAVDERDRRRRDERAK